MVKKQKTGFTLAEVLITITIIGVVAALTIPNLLADVNQRKYNAASGNFQRKLGEALKIMSAQNTLKGHKTTLSFVNELGKNFKIIKVCTTVTDCFPAEFKKSSGAIVETSTLTTATSLGKSYGTETVGVQFADGIKAIVAYNPDYTTQSNGDIVKFTKADKTVQMNTNVISMIFDVSEDDNNKIGEDIFQKNTNLGSSGVCEHTKVGDYCIKDLTEQATYIDCSSTTNTPDTIKYCESSTRATDYFAGAKKECDLLEMKLLNNQMAPEIYQMGITTGGTPRSGRYWIAKGELFDFGYGTSSPNGINWILRYGVLCVAN